MTTEPTPGTEDRGRSPLALFVLMGFACSWTLWAPLTLGGPSRGSASAYLHLLGGLGPAVAALWVTRLEGRVGWRALVRRLDPRCVSWAWLAFAALAPVVLYAVAALVLGLGGQGWPRLADFGASREYAALGRPAYWLANIVFYGFGEEIGWRGYLLPRLQERLGARTAAFIVSVIWALWHLPLFSFAAGMRTMGPVEILGWFLSLTTGSYLLTWLTNSSASIVPAAIFHGVLDITMGSPGHPTMANIMGAILTVAAIAAAVATGPNLLWPRPAPANKGEGSAPGPRHRESSSLAHPG
jgi:membrane protease YdiL (CAAX protease family)